MGIKGLPAITPASPFEGCNVSSAMGISSERIVRAFPQRDAHCFPAGVLSGDECGVGDRHPTRHVRATRSGGRSYK